MEKKDFDAVVIGSGPNGLAAAVTMQSVGLKVLLVEGKSTVGGGLRTEALTLPGFKHDVCSAIHPLAVASPFFRRLPLSRHGLSFAKPPIAAAHPLDDGQASILQGDLPTAMRRLGADGGVYGQLLKPILRNWESVLEEALAPLHVPRHLGVLLPFGLRALPPASFWAGRFSTEAARALWAGMAAHSIQPLDHWATSAIGLMLLAAGHTEGGGPFPLAVHNPSPMLWSRISRRWAAPLKPNFTSPP